MKEEAIEFVAEFYNVTREEIIALYWDEVEAYMCLLAIEESSNDYSMSNMRSTRGLI